MSTFPPLYPRDASRYLPKAAELRPVVRNLWAWTANSYRLRGYDLVTCLRKASEAVEDKYAIEKLQATSEKKRRRKGRRKSKKAPPHVIASVLVRNAKKRARRLADAHKIRRGEADTGG